MKIYKFLIAFTLVFILMGSVSSADNATQNDEIQTGNSSDTSITDSYGANDLYADADKNTTQDEATPTPAGDAENHTSNTTDNSFLDNEIQHLLENDSSEANLTDNNNGPYDNQYYLFRGDCWTFNNNFESSVALTSETLTDLTVTGTFRTRNDLVGLYWNSKDPIQHPYISYGERSDYSNVILEFDYIMSGCMDFSRTTISIASNTGEIYYFAMKDFIKKNHVKLEFNKLKLKPGNKYIDRNGKTITVKKATKLDVTNLKYIMLHFVPANYVDTPNHYVIMKNVDFTCKIYNIAVTNGKICDEQMPLQPHQYHLCEGYDDTYNLNPYRLAKEMRKLGYVDWVNLYIGASHFYEKSGRVGDVIVGMDFNNARTEKMVLDKNVPLNKAFKAWLDCYSRQLKKNDVENLVISVSMENLQCPQSWRQMDSNGNYAVTGWNPSTFILSPCHKDVIPYMQKVCGACLDVVVANGLQPILQMGEIWWWWNENELPNQSPCFYDASTRAKYLLEHGTALPEYSNAWTADYDEKTVDWLNQQLVQYSEAIGEVVKSDKYKDGLYVALFFLPSVTDTDRVPPMMRDANYLQDAYSPYKLDILQIEDYDWVIYESLHHEEAYEIGQELGFNESNLHYFGGFVLYPEDASKYWSLIQKSLEDAIEKKFKEVYIWAGTQVRRDSKILGYDEYAIINNLKLTNKPGIVSPIITAPSYAGAGEKFTIKMRTNDWINGAFNVYDYKDGNKGKLLASSKIVNGLSSLDLSSINAGLNRFYLEFDYINGEYHLIQDVYIIENSKNVIVNVTGEIEKGFDVNVALKAPKNPNGHVYISVDEKSPDSYAVKDGEFKTSIPKLSDGYHKIAVKYDDGSYINGKFVGDAYYNIFTVKVGIMTMIETVNVNAEYNSGVNLAVNLKDSKNNPLKGKTVSIRLNGQTYTLTTDIKGYASLPINLLPGNYSAEISYTGDDVYLSSSAKANVNVGKISTAITAKDISVSYGEKTNLAITLKDSKNKALNGKNILITLNGQNHTLTTDKNGLATLPIDLLPGKYTAKILFKEENLYLSSSASVSVIVNKIPTILTADELVNNLVITLKDNNGNALNGKNILISLNGKNSALTTDKNGQASLPIDLLPGTYVAKISFGEDNVYLPSSANVSVIVNKIATALSAQNITLTYGNPAGLTITLKDKKNNALSGKNVIITLNGMNHTLTTDKKGQAQLPIDLLPGKYTAKILFSQDNTYLTSSANINIIVNKAATSLKANNINFIYQDPANLEITLKDANNNALSGKNIIVTLNGMNHTLTTDKSGRAVLPVDLLPGKYTAKILFKEDNVYMSSSANANVIVNKLATALTVNDIVNNLAITLKDKNGNALNNKNVLITLNGMTHTLTTDKNGQAQLPINLLPGNYTAKILFREDRAYLSSSANVNIIINKLVITLTARNINITYPDKTNLTIGLKDAENNALSGKNLLIALNGMNHTLTTDKNGQAILPIDLPPGNYTANIYFKQDSTHLASCASISVIVNKLATTLTSKNINVTYPDKTNLAITLKDIKNNALKGKSVLITLNGMNHTVTTDKNGQATLAIDLLPGKYTAKILFSQDNIYQSASANADIIVNKIKTSLTAQNINVTYGNPANLLINLKDNADNALVERQVIITLDGMNYTVTTDKNGQATLPIDLIAGKYTAKILFRQDNVYLSSQASANVIVNRATTILTAKDITLTYNNQANLEITLKDIYNNPLKGKSVLITLNGMNHTVTTDKNGQATLAIDLLPGKYTAKILFSQDNSYMTSKASANVIVNKAATSLTAENINVTYGNPANLLINLKDNADKALVDRHVIVTINDIKHMITTDKNGQATLPIDLLPGNYTAKIQFGEDNVHLSSSVNVNVVINKIDTALDAKDITFTYDNPASLVITLKDNAGNVLADKYITVSLNDKVYSKKTDENGQVKISPKLPSNKYAAKITFEGDGIYKSSSGSAKIAVKKATPILAASSKTFKVKSKTKKVTVTLKNKNKPVKNAIVKLTVNKKTYKVKTNSKGVATFNLKLTKKGRYSAVYKFAGNSNFKSSSKSFKIIIK